MITTRNASRRLARLTPLADALRHIDRSVSPVAPRVVTIRTAPKHILAGADIVAVEPRPSMPLALRDGWALRAEATLDATSYTPAVLAQPPVAVEVGDPLPANADAVAPYDTVEFRGTAANALLAVAAGEGVLPRGADIAPGAALFKVGRRISWVDLAVLTAIGQPNVTVREPRVRIVPSRPGGTIIDGIVTLLSGAIETDGGCAITSEPADGSGVDNVFRSADVDAIIVVGGSGTGERDNSVDTLARLGQLAFHGVGLAPGETTAFGMTGSCPVLVVPGRLDAALAAWLVLGRYVLARLCGRDREDPIWSLTLSRKITSTVGLAEVVVARREESRAVPLASGYLSLQALANADGWIFVPVDLEGIPADATVVMKPLP
jgi:molybdopterin molybdotransferase